MDDIYGDLENYNDVNAIDELRNENKELKFQVEKRESEIAKLQKEYDRLQSEFNKLQINYSSLLKTARAEVERKAQIITSLNQEKDMMVLNSLKNSDKSLLNIRRNLLRNGIANHAKSPKDLETKKNDFDRDRRKDENRYPSEDTVTTSGNTDEVDAKKAKVDLYKDIHGESKENTPNAKSRPQSIRNRRKSMPVLNKHNVRFSSDEEFEENDSVEESKKKDRSRDEKHKRVFDRNKHKVSETSGIDDKYSSHHESSRETYFKNRTRFERDRRASDKFRSTRDNYEGQRHRRNLSPERIRRPPRDYPDDPYQKPENRHRILESPPNDRAYDHRRPRERRLNHERPYGERSRSRNDNRAAKHKLPSDYEETLSKRARTDSLHKQTVQPVEESVKQPMKDPKPVEERVATLVSENLQEDSCQSPDYETVSRFAHCEVAPVPREIKLTASAKLDDPRLKSNKYTLDTGGGGEMLTTVVGRNVDLKPIDTSTWNIPRVPIPEALRILPEQYDTSAKKLPQTSNTDNILKKIYLDIDNPVSNLSVSMESGEIHSDSEIPNVDASSERYFNNLSGKTSEVKTVQHSVRGGRHEVINEKMPIGSKSHNKCKESSDQISKDDDGSVRNLKYDVASAHSASLPKSEAPLKLLAKYKIPKRSKLETTASKSSEEVIRNVLRESLTKEPDNITNAKSNLSDLNKSHEKTPASHDDKSVDSSRDSVQNTSDPKPRIVLKLCELKGYRKLSPRDIVAGDLELSDETNDFVDMPRRKSKDITKTDTHDHKAKTKDITRESINNDPVVGKKKQKTKNKSHKLKDSKAKHSSDDTVTKEVTDKKLELNSEKEFKTLDKKAKFTELFGESCSGSLITPEDLGVIPAGALPPGSYLPMLEDTQDAVDINVKEIAKVRTKPDTHNIDEKTDPKTVEAGPETSQQSHTTTENNEKNRDESNEGASNTQLNDADIKTLYENLFPGDDDTKDTEVVKTVVLATGSQPREVSQSVSENNSIDANKVDIPHFGLPNLHESPLHALATSTPYRPTNMVDIVLETPLKVRNISEEARPESCSSSQMNVERMDTSSRSQSSLSTVSQVEGDVPDVRIFLRRRKKGVKKPA